MSTPNPTDTVTATPNPGPIAVTGATGISVVLGYVAMLLGAKYKIPAEVVGAGLTGLASVATSIWHRFFGPAVKVTKS